VESTGDPSFCTLWTFLGVPAISLPLMQAENGLPLGVQLVGPRNGDARLLRTAQWLANRLAQQ
jgi:Asp-tRNA(Asn)/Glu-tRNA(Gln) amidotransferase A subunit family amidase